MKPETLARHITERVTATMDDMVREADHLAKSKRITCDRRVFLPRGYKATVKLAFFVEGNTAYVRGAHVELYNKKGFWVDDAAFDLYGRDLEDARQRIIQEIVGIMG